jgi:hypothetical protein
LANEFPDLGESRFSRESPVAIGKEMIEREQCTLESGKFDLGADRPFSSPIDVSLHHCFTRPFRLGVRPEDFFELALVVSLDYGGTTGRGIMLEHFRPFLNDAAKFIDSVQARLPEYLNVKLAGAVVSRQ